MSKENMQEQAAEVENEIQTTQEETDLQPREKVEPRLALEPKEGPKSLRNLLKKSVDEHNHPDKNVNKVQEKQPSKNKSQEAKNTAQEEKEEDKSSPKDAKDSVASKEAAKPSTNQTTEVVTQPTTQKASVPAPAALSKEIKDKWDSLDEQVRQEFVRRESDVQKGVDQLKSKYQPIEDVLAPIRPLLQANGLNDAMAVKQLFDWHRALSAPNKAAQIGAFKALAQSHGVDLNQLAPASIQPVSTEATQQAPEDPLKQLESLLEAKLQPVNQQLNFYQQELQRQKSEAANAEVMTFSKDKPLMEDQRVKTKMAQLLQSAVQFQQPMTLQQAYDEAVWGLPDLREQFMQGQIAKKEAEFKAQQEATLRQTQEAEAEKTKKASEEEAERKRKEAEALEKARRANVSLRGSTPTNSVTAQKQSGRKTTSVADSIRASLQEVRGANQI